MTVLLGNGDGTFQAPTTAFFNDGEYPQAVAVGDFNGDASIYLSTAAIRISSRAAASARF